MMNQEQHNSGDGGIVRMFINDLIDKNGRREGKAESGKWKVESGKFAGRLGHISYLRALTIIIPIIPIIPNSHFVYPSPS